MTTTTRSVGARVDSPIDTGFFAWRPYWQRTHYPEIGIYVHTAWWKRDYDGEHAVTAITESLTDLPGALYRKEYDSARVTVGGLAETHEAVCARVERGELP